MVPDTRIDADYVLGGIFVLWLLVGFPLLILSLQRKLRTLQAKLPVGR